MGTRPWASAPGSYIEGAIIDKNCRIGQKARIANAHGIDYTEESDFGMIRDGVVVVPKESLIPNGWTLE